MKLFEIFSPIHEEGNLSGTAVTGLHSGNLGDIVYCIPTIRKLAINHLILNLCTDPFFSGRTLTKDSAISLAQFLISSKVIEKVSVVNTQVPFEYTDPHAWGLHYILDRFRSKGYDQRLHLGFQQALPFGLQVNINDPWLNKSTGKRTFSKPYIAIGLTSRYRRFDNGYYEQLFREIPPENLVFIGTPFDQMERCSIQGQHFQSNHFSEITEVISNCEAFIGNPSFLYALAEAMKAPRFVEVPENNNVYPIGLGGHLLHQYRRESLRRQLIELLKIPTPRSIEIDLMALYDEVDFLKKNAEVLKNPVEPKAGLAKKIRRLLK